MPRRAELGGYRKVFDLIQHIHTVDQADGNDIAIIRHKEEKGIISGPLLEADDRVLIYVKIMVVREASVIEAQHTPVSSNVNTYCERLCGGRRRRRVFFKAHDHYRVMLGNEGVCRAAQLSAHILTVKRQLRDLVALVRLNDEGYEVVDQH